MVFWLLGHPTSLAEAIGQIVKTAGFGIPGGLGVQEGGVMLAASWLAMPADLALVAMLIRRIRDLAYGVIGLFVWTMLEGGRGQRISLQRGIDTVHRGCCTAACRNTWWCNRYGKLR